MGLKALLSAQNVFSSSVRLKLVVFVKIENKRKRVVHRQHGSNEFADSLFLENCYSMENLKEAQYIAS